MREIKFRVWHEEDKCFIYCEPFDPNTVSGGGYTKDKGVYYHFWPDANISGELCQIKNCHLQNRPIQQFTGLKDKNGKDIYEGDIINYKQTNKFELKMKVENGFAYPCGHRYFGLFFVDINDNDFIINPANVSFNFEMEIIGNIFENPELIK